MMPTFRRPDARVVLHGHFYQPPRESPWTDEIPEQPSAQPYHDWNERIHQECYRPNSASRVLDGFGRIRRIVNNFWRQALLIDPENERTRAYVARAERQLQNLERLRSEPPE